MFEAISDVKYIGLNVHSIYKCLNGKVKTAHSLRWKYITKEQFNILKPKVRYIDIHKLR